MIFSYIPQTKKQILLLNIFILNGSTQTLVMKLLSNELLLQKVKDVWNEVTNNGFNVKTMTKFIDQQVQLIYQSQKLNFIRWDILKEKQFLQPVARGSYEAEIGYLTEFIKKRFDILGQIVNSATIESVNEKVKGGWEWPNWGKDNN